MNRMRVAALATLIYWQLDPPHSHEHIDKQAEGKVAKEAPSSRIEESTTSRNEADKLKAKWAAEKKKEVC